jgi:hypothetical protein
MRKILLALVPAAGLLAAPTIAAAEGTAGGAAAGAIGGAIIGGPVGAVAGLIIGGVVGTVIDPPPPAVNEFVATQEGPPVYLEGNLVVGAQLPRQVTLYPVPADPTYAYAFINGHRVIVDPQTYVVVQIVS